MSPRPPRAVSCAGRPGGGRFLAAVCACLLLLPAAGLSADLRLVCVEPRCVAGMDEGTELLVLGVPEGGEAGLRWSAGDGRLTSPRTLAPGVLGVRFVPAAGAAAGEQEIRVELGGAGASCRVEVLAPLVLRLSRPAATAGDKDPVLVEALGADGKPAAGPWLLQASAGTLEARGPGAWRFRAAAAAAPERAWLTLLDRARPGLVLARASVDMAVRKEIGVALEDGASLWIRLAGRELGPFTDFGGRLPVEIPPGLDEITFLARDRAGNEKVTRQQLRLPPPLDLVVRADLARLPLGGFPCRLVVTSRDKGLKAADLEVAAAPGTCSPLRELEPGVFACTYTSPQAGRPGVAAVTITSLPGGAQASRYRHDLELTAGLLHRAVASAAEVSRTSDGGTQAAVVLALTDTGGNPVTDAEFEVDFPGGKALEVMELEEGRYAFRMNLPKGTDLSRIALRVRLTPANPDLAGAHLLPFTGADGTTRLLALDGGGRPMSGCALALGEGDQPAEIRTDDLGLAALPARSGRDLERVRICFKDAPGRQMAVLLAPAGLAERLAAAQGRKGLPPERERDLATASGEATLAIATAADGSALELRFSAEPKRLTIIPASPRFQADGARELRVDLLVLNKDGLGVPGRAVEVLAGGVTLGLAREEKGGRYTLSFAPAAVSSATRLALEARVRDSEVRAEARVDLLPPDAAASPAVSLAGGETTAAAGGAIAATTSPGVAAATTIASVTSSTSPGAAATTVAATVAASTSPGAVTVVASTPAGTAPVAGGGAGAPVAVYAPAGPADAQLVFPKTLEFSVPVKDQDGKAAPDGTEVTLAVDKGALSTTAVSTKGGAASATYTPLDEAYTATITATVAGKSASFRVAVQPEPRAYTLELATEAVLAYPAQATLTATVRDQKGRPAPDGLEVAFAADAGTVDARAVTAGGAATARFTPPEREAPALTLKATGLPKTLALDATLALTLTPEVKQVSAKACQVTTSCGGASRQAKVTVNYPAATFEVAFQAGQGGFSPAAVTTAGEAVRTVYSPPGSVGTQTLQAVVAGRTLFSWSMEIMAGKADKPALSLDRSTVTAAGSGSVEVRAEVKDAFNNPVANARVEFQVAGRVATLGANLPEGTFVNDTARTDSSGLARARYAVGTIPGQTRITARLPDMPAERFVPQEVTLTEEPSAPVLRLETAADGSGSAPASVSVAAGSSATLYAVARDAFGHVLGNVAATWSLAAATGGVAAGDLAPAADGKGVAFGARLAGTARLEAASAAWGTASCPLVAGPGPAAALRLAGAAQVVAGQDLAVSVSAHDAFGNLAGGYAGARALVFSGASPAGAQAPAAAAGGATIPFGQPLSAVFDGGRAAVVLRLYKTESATVHAAAGAVASGAAQGAALAATVLPAALGSFDLGFTRLGDNNVPGVYLVVTARDLYGNPRPGHARAQDIVFSLASGTQSGQNIVWFDLPSGMVDNGDGTARLPSSAAGAFDAAGRLAAGLADTKAEAMSVRVAEGPVQSVSPSFTWAPGAPAALVFLDAPAAAVDAGAALPSFRVAVMDAFGNQVTGDNGRTVSLTVSSGPAAFSNGSAVTAGGVATFAAASYPSAGTVTFAATAAGLRDTRAATLAVGGGTVASFLLEPLSAAATAGAAASYRLVSRNAAGTTATGYTGTVAFSCGDPQAVLPAARAFVAADQGTATVQAVFKTAGAQVLRATDAAAGVSAPAAALTVQPGAAVKLAFAGLPASALVGGTWSAFTVRVTDDFGNTAPVAASVQVALQSGAGALAGTLARAATAGVARFDDLSVDTAGSVTLKASAAGLADATGAAVVLAGPGLHRFRVQAPVSTVVRGQPLLLVLVSALDASGAVLTGYTGTVRLRSSDAAATLPADTVFQAHDRGEFAFTNQVVLRTTGSQTISAADVALPASEGTSAAIAVVEALVKPGAGAAARLASTALHVLPPRFSPDGGTGSDTVAVCATGLDQGTTSALLSVLSGPRVVRTLHRSVEDGYAVFRWNGRDDGARLVEPGVYGLELRLLDAAGAASAPLAGEVEVEGDIDLGAYGP